MLWLSVRSGVRTRMLVPTLSVWSSATRNFWASCHHLRTDVLVLSSEC